MIFRWRVPDRRAWTTGRGGIISRVVSGFIFAAMASNFHLAGVARAEIGQKIETTMDYDCACGDPECGPDSHLGKKGDFTELKIRSKSFWNASRLILEADVTYHFLPARDATWKDASVETDVDGWWPTGWKAWFMAVAKPLLRAPDQKLFQLMGLNFRSCYNDNHDCAAQFPIGKAGFTFKPAASGEFCAYANDLPFAYDNNSGEIALRITRK
jgi:hypothetical protein